MVPSSNKWTILSVHTLFCSNKASWQSVILFLFIKMGKYWKCISISTYLMPKKEKKYIAPSYTKNIILLFTQNSALGLLFMTSLSSVPRCDTLITMGWTNFWGNIISLFSSEAVYIFQQKKFENKKIWIVFSI